MNVAVDPERRREGVATALIKHLLGEIDGTDKVMLEVRGLERGRDRDVPAASASRPSATAAATTRTTARTRS